MAHRVGVGVQLSLLDGPAWQIEGGSSPPSTMNARVLARGRVVPHHVLRHGHQVGAELLDREDHAVHGCDGRPRAG